MRVESPEELREHKEQLRAKKKISQRRYFSSWKARNEQRNKEYMKKYLREYMRKYYSLNREEILAYKRNRYRIKKESARGREAGSLR